MEGCLVSVYIFEAQELLESCAHYLDFYSLGLLGSVDTPRMVDSQTTCAYSDLGIVLVVVGA